MMNKKLLGYLGVAALALIGAAAHATVVPNVLFSDEAVLQRGMSLPVWGTAAPGEQVKVAIDGDSASTTAGPDGNWMVRLKPLTAGGPYTLTISGPTNTVTANDVLVGDVWIASGQSNMQFPLAMNATSQPPPRQWGGPPNWQQELASSADPQFRFWFVRTRASANVETNVPGKWQVVGPDTIGPFSAVAYYFGRDIRQDQKVPVGIIGTYWGGTAAESWTSREALAASPVLKPLLDAADAAIAAYPQQLAAYNAAMAAATPAAPTTPATPAAAGATAAPATPAAPAPPALKPPLDPVNRAPVATVIYNGMVAPLEPYAIKGAIWYQGESNGGRGWQYQTLFPAMIADWRKHWGEGDFPFYFAQLAPFTKISATPQQSGWAEVRNAQLLTLTALPNTGMAVITDLGDQTTVHPLRKEPVGDRLGLIARVLTYGEKMEYSGPLYSRSEVQGSTIRIHFTHDEGLRPAAVQDSDGTQIAPPDKLVGFTIAGADQNFVNADAVIDGNTVVVSSPTVPSPVAVRYGWAFYPVCNLQNSASLWASPFRTDSWQLTSQPKTP
jgi:sialate O-acetylesterase